MMKFIIYFLFLMVGFQTGSAQTEFVDDPDEAVFITQDIPLFWNAFDDFVKNGGNPFKDYVEEGSMGVQDFIPYRIESAENLKQTVKKREADYLRIREGSFEVMNTTDEIRSYYRNFKEIYGDAIFPPAYFVIGAFNSGGTSTASGLIIGVEVQDNVANVPYIVAHELIHFNQYYPNEPGTLLSQSIREGSADFIGELISGKHINEKAFAYGNEHEEELCALFVDVMEGKDFQGWLYGSKGKQEGWPNDLGYWMGYQICSAYYEKAEDKKLAVREILTIDDFDTFLASSGYLDEYMK